jgi:putative oxidoreductase
MNNTVVPLVGRILLAALFLIAAYNKVTNVAGTVGYFGKLGLPSPDILVWVVIAVEAVGGIFTVIGFQTRVVAWGMAIFTLLTAIFGHKFWVDPGQMTNFLKNLSIMGGFLMLAVAGPGRLSVDRR